MFNWIKDWSGWSTAGTIFKARMEQLAGIITAGVAGLVAFDWMPYLTTGEINWKSLATIAAGLFAYGLLGEFVRRRNAKDL